MDIDSFKNDGPPRSETTKEETEQIFEHLKNRGDLRIGQYLINAVCETDMYSRALKQTGCNHHECIELVLYDMEAEELLEAIKKYDG